MSDREAMLEVYFIFLVVIASMILIRALLLLYVRYHRKKNSRMLNFSSQRGVSVSCQDPA